MNFKLPILLAALCGHVCILHAASTPMKPPAFKPLRFYVGAAGGIDHMSGKRSESSSLDNGAGRRITQVYSDNRKIRANNATLSALIGVLWKPSPFPFVLGGEVFFGRGNALSSLKDSRRDPALNETIFYSTDFQRKFFYGGLLRVGYQFTETYLAYLSAGLEQSQFTQHTILTNEAGNRIPVTDIKRTHRFNGILWGMGIERNIDPFTVGVDLRMTQYGRKNFVNNVNAAPASIPGFLNISIRPIVYSATLRICYYF